MHLLTRLFSPRSIAVIGASRTKGKLGYDVLHNILDHGYPGAVFPINPTARRIAKRKAYPSVTQVKESIDLAVIIIPAKAVTTVLEECGAKQIPFAVVISAGFKETGKVGAQLEKQITATAAKHNIRLVGPNCLGFINTTHHLNASFAAGMPKRGNVSLISQSGAMAVAMIDWAHKSRLGFSHLISIGNKADIDEVECLEYLAHDPHTQVIMMYAESITRGREFMKTAAQITPYKPIVLLKAGLSMQAKQAVQSHTGSLAGSEEALDAACKKSGIIRARTIKDFFDFGLVLSKQPLPATPRIGIITNAGGPGIMAVDALAHTPLLLPSLSGELQAHLRMALPAAASTHNPVDVIGDAKPERYEHALHGLLASNEIDSALVILTPQVMTRPAEVARSIAEIAHQYTKPIVTSFIGGTDVEEARHILEHANIPHYDTPERAIAALNTLAQQAQHKPSQRWIHETSGQFVLPFTHHPIQLATQEAEQLLQQYAMPTLTSHLLRTPKECKTLKQFPLVMKIASRDVIHKAAVGGVELHIQSPEDARRAFERIQKSVHEHLPHALIDGMLTQPQLAMAAPHRELIIGMKRDTAFGPVMMCGIGGSMVELFHDVAFGLAPLSRTEARKMFFSLKAAPLLHGYELETAISTLVALSRLSLDYPQISSIDINPLVLYETGKGGIIVDVRMML